ncbi:immunity 49 family protein [Gordonia sp. L191]|uniref:immunity 49 family protein n=1 Tax=Gordonia sp. L191 TaxID=2982699 RepID=UPI0024BFEB14|nr:immunity 49 family protein [Gordonia sp. L191]WHU48607.1 immunity 49 family protein [Gordonia sp. L191]
MVDIAVWHDCEIEGYVQRRWDAAERGVERMFGLDFPWNSHRIHDLQDYLVDQCVWSLVGSDGVVGEEVWGLLDAACEVARVQFVRASLPKGEHRLWFEVLGNELTTKSSGPNPYTMAPHWLGALWLGLVARDRGLLDVLRDFKPEWREASREEGVWFDPYQEQWARAWQMLLRGERGEPVAQQVVEVMRLADPELAPYAGAESVLQRVFPSVRLLWDVVSGSRSEFPRDVRVALEGNKEFFTRPVEDRVRAEEGFVPWRILGPVCAAVDSGFEVGVASQYLPAAFLYDRRDRLR